MLISRSLSAARNVSCEIVWYFVPSTVAFNSHPWLNRDQVYSIFKWLKSERNS